METDQKLRRIKNIRHGLCLQKTWKMMGEMTSKQKTADQVWNMKSGLLVDKGITGKQRKEN